MSGYTMTQAELLYTLSAAVTKNTYTTEALISAAPTTAPVATIPAGFFGSVPNGVGRSLYLHAEGTIGSVSSPTFGLNMGIDTTAGNKGTAVTIMAATTMVAGPVPFHFDAWFTCQAVGTTGGTTLQVNGKFEMDGGTSGAAAVASGLRTGFASTITGLLDTTQYFLELFGTWSVSSATNSTILQQMLLFGLN